MQRNENTGIIIMKIKKTQTKKRKGDGLDTKQH